MFCSNCGNEVTEFDKFCTKCGSEVSHSKPDTSVTSTEAQDVSVRSGATEQPVAGGSATPESPAAPAASVSEVAPTTSAAPAPATPASTTPAAESPAPATESPAAPAPAATTPASESPAVPTPATPAPTQETMPFATVSQAPNQELTSPPQKKSRIGVGVVIGVAGSIITVLIILLVAGFLMSTEENTHTDTEVVEGYDDTEYDWEYDWDTEYDWDDLKVADANGNVTGYACINLNGEDLVEVMLENDYAWSYLDECYLRSSDLAAVGFMDTTGELLSRDEILALQEGAANEPVMIINSVGGYDSLMSAFNGALGVDLSDSAYGDEEIIVGLLENNYGEQYLVIAFAHGDGTYDMCFINDSGVEGGLFYDLTGASGYTSVAEVWSDITSGSLSIDEDYEDTISTTGTITTTVAS